MKSNILQYVFQLNKKQCILFSFIMYHSMSRFGEDSNMEPIEQYLIFPSVSAGVCKSFH